MASLWEPLGLDIPRARSPRSPRFDPFQVFEVTHRPCHVAKVKVLNGEKITKGWGDYLDTPDPYVTLEIVGEAHTKHETQVINNDPNPAWNEEFLLYYDQNKPAVLRIQLMDSNYSVDEHIGTLEINVQKYALYKTVTERLQFKNGSAIYVEITIEIDDHPELRFSLSLCGQEKEFVEKRKQRVFTKLQEWLGTEDGPKSSCDVPVISVMGSGGGFRAMAAMSGVMKALEETGLIDCVTYTAALSGSSWCIASIYSHPEWPNKPMAEVQKEIRENISWNPLRLLNPQSVSRYVSNMLQKRRNGQPVSFVDFFGHMIGETLLKTRLDSKLTDQRAKLVDERIPMPLYTCCHVKKDVAARVFSEWMEFTPFEIGLPKYGTFMQSEHFGSKFFMGQLVKEYREPPLHYLLGVWGSAFSILFKRLRKNPNQDPVQMVRDEIKEEQRCEQEHDDIREELEKEMIELDSEESDEEDSGTDGDSTSEDEKLEKHAKKARKQTLKEKETKKSYFTFNFWNSIIDNVLSSAPLSRSYRAGIVHNFMRGLELSRAYPFSPFAPATETSAFTYKDDSKIADHDGDFQGSFEALPTGAKKIIVVDAGLTFNSPYPLVLRPQRAIDIILSFDFSARPHDSSRPFKELLLAERWARVNRVPFPKIDPAVFDREGMKEAYVFADPDPRCPIVVHFVLVNIEFRKHLSPGVPRTTAEDLKFADFDIFDDPTAPYSTFNFQYDNFHFDRLAKLAEFNTLLNIDLIKEVIIKKITHIKKNPHVAPIQLADVERLHLSNSLKAEQLKEYLAEINRSRVQEQEQEPEFG